MAPDRTNTGAIATDVTAKHGKVRELLHVLRTPRVLGNAHAINNDRALSLHVNMRCVFDLLASKSGVPLDIIPSSGFYILGERLDSERVFPDEVPVQDLGKAVGARSLVGFNHHLHDSFDGSRVAAHAHLIELRADLASKSGLPSQPDSAGAGSAQAPAPGTD